MQKYYLSCMEIRAFFPRVVPNNLCFDRLYLNCFKINLEILGCRLKCLKFLNILNDAQRGMLPENLAKISRSVL